jgi:hypothetical protein
MEVCKKWDSWICRNGIAGLPRHVVGVLRLLKTYEWNYGALRHVVGVLRLLKLHKKAIYTSLASMW